MKTTEMDNLMAQENFIRVITEPQSLRYYLHYIGGIIHETFLWDTNNEVWEIRTSLDRTLTSWQDVQTHNIPFEVISPDEFLEIKQVSICELD